MKAYRHDVTRSLNKDSLIPDFTATGILDINFKRLKEKGVKHVLIDLDLTLRKKRVYSLDPEIRNYLLKAMDDNNFESLNIASNNMTPLGRYARPLEAGIFQPYVSGFKLIRKPSAPFYNRILKSLKAPANSCVMIGDKLKGDVFGGNKAGMLTVLVEPRGNDYWYDRLLRTRHREQKAMQKFFPDYEA